MRFTSLLAATAALALLAGPALAASGDTGSWRIRARALGVFPDESGTANPIGGSVDIDDSIVPELDFTYFFTDNVAAELIAAVTPHPATVEGTAVGNVDLGDVWLLPPTLTLQYHFDPMSKFEPYVGAGVNYTHFFNADHPTGVITSIDYDDSFGFALQAGFDYWLNDKWAINLDVKKVFIETDVTVQTVLGTVTSTVDIDPWLVGAGLTRRF